MTIMNYNSILDIIIDTLIPETKIAVHKGNKIFGALIVKKSDLSLGSTGTNNEITNPLYHGEISALFNFFKSKNLNAKDYYFSNVIARSSKTMIECNNSKINFKSTGTEG